MRRTSGLSLLILIFLSLALITFSLMSLSSATADRNLSQKSADRTEEYYQAISCSNEVLAKLDAILVQYFTSQTNSGMMVENAVNDSHLALCRELPSLLTDLPEAVSDLSFDADQYVLSFTVQIKDDQILLIELSLTCPTTPEDPLYEIIRRQVINQADWNPDYSQNLYQINQ